MLGHHTQKKDWLEEDNRGLLCRSEKGFVRRKKVSVGWKRGADGLGVWNLTVENHVWPEAACVLTSSKHVQMHAGKPKWCLVHNSACEWSGVHTNVFTFTHTLCVSCARYEHVLVSAGWSSLDTYFCSFSLCVRRCFHCHSASVHLYRCLLSQRSSNPNPPSGWGAVYHTHKHTDNSASQSTLHLKLIVVNFRMQT